MPVPADAPPPHGDAAGPLPGRSTHRRRRRASRPSGPPQTAASPQQPPAPAAPPDPEPAIAAAKRRSGPRPDTADRAWRDLAGSGPSQVGVDGALRARDVNRPSDAELADAERDVVVVRRNWRPEDR